MDAERIRALAEAYGGDPRRWPDAVRATATAWIARQPEEAARILFDARQTDAALDASPRPAVSHALRDRVIASAAPAGLTPRRAGSFGWAMLRLPRGVWLSGAGMAAAACAGVVIGQGLMGRMTTDLQADAVLYEASLAPVDYAEVLG